MFWRILGQGFGSQGEACWWTVHPASKQRSEGEKVRVGDDLILVSVATERYLHTTKQNDLSIVNASFHGTQWSVQPFGTGLSRVKNVGKSGEIANISQLQKNSTT
ncbi:unnamed protein product [Allacma fusca]|uniref:MIR domain-containing protein n=1 Tax=Allacma fusca TaxID=39272 RepID=A0A8J2KKB7_9HEXA|nr:unnamed protein product [Allacma fusca]